MIRVLIVEDDQIAAEAHADYVARVPGFAVAGHAGNGADALRRLAREKIDLVLLDIYLPDMTGLDVLRRMRALGHTADVIAVTRARDMAVVHASVTFGAVQYLIKPFTFNTVRGKLDRYRAYRVSLSGREQLIVQQEVDDLLATLREPDVAGLPKGISRESLHAVVVVLQSLPEDAGFSAGEVAQEIGASRVTARRYLEYLVKAHLVARHHRYGNAGRPEIEYSWQTSGGHRLPPHS